MPRRVSERTPRSLSWPLARASPIRAPGDLAAPRLAAQLPGELAELRDPGRPDGLALRERPAARVHRQHPAERGEAAVDERGPLAVRRELERLVCRQLARRRGVVDLRAVDALGSDPGRLVGDASGAARGRERVGPVFAHERRGEHARGARAAAPAALGRGQDNGRRALRRGRDHRAAERPGEQLAVEHLARLDGRRHERPWVRGAVGAVLCHDARELLLGRAGRAHVVAGRGRERIDPAPPPVVAARVRELATHAQHQVVHAACHREPAQVEGGRAGHADRWQRAPGADAEEMRVARAGLTVAARQRERGHLAERDPGVGQRGRDRLAGELVAASASAREGGGTDPEDMHPAHSGRH